MRAMRQTITLVALLACAGCGDDNKKVGPDMSMALDLAPGADMAMRVPDGVACGAMTCPVGQNCCVAASGTAATGAMCIAAGGTCSGAVLACDGPEDCSNGSSPFCCGTINFTGGTPDGGAPMFNGGNASCTGSCDFTFGGSSVKTRLCHADMDCTGLTAFGMALDKCCSSTMAVGLHFCAAPLAAGITCP